MTVRLNISVALDVAQLLELHKTADRPMTRIVEDAVRHWMVCTHRTEHTGVQAPAQAQAASGDSAWEYLTPLIGSCEGPTAAETAETLAECEQAQGAWRGGPLPKPKNQRKK